MVTRRSAAAPIVVVVVLHLVVPLLGDTQGVERPLGDIEILAHTVIREVRSGRLAVLPAAQLCPILGHVHQVVTPELEKMPLDI